VIVWVHIAASFLMRFVPVRLAYRVVGALTPLVLLFAPGHFRRARANMAQVVGPTAPPVVVRRLTVAAFANYARYMVDLVRLPNIAPEHLEDGIEVRGWEHVEAAFALGRGAILVTGHIGNWDLGGAGIAGRGKTVCALVETLKPPRWNERVQRIREHMGLKAIPVENGVRDMLAALRRQEGLAIVVDRPATPATGVPITFFGRRTYVPGGAATLAIRTGAPVVPAVLIRNADLRGFVAYIGEPFFPSRGKGTDAEIQALTQNIMSWLEGMIRRYPDQWYMFRLMWPAARQMGHITIGD
jgi:KDO2-lipid IV(A) lauroyltransferase